MGLKNTCTDNINTKKGMRQVVALRVGDEGSSARVQVVVSGHVINISYPLNDSWALCLHLPHYLIMPFFSSVSFSFLFCSSRVSTEKLLAAVNELH